MSTGRCLVLAAVCGIAVRVADAQSPNLRTRLPGVATPILLDSIAYASRLAGSVTQVLAVVDSVYAEYGLPVRDVDPDLGLVPSRRVIRTRQLGKAAMSRYVDCGRGFSGENANFYRVTLSTAAWPEAVGRDSVVLHVALIAAGQDPAGSRSGYVLCNSKGAFEEEFAAKLKARLAVLPGRGEAGRQQKNTSSW